MKASEHFLSPRDLEVIGRWGRHHAPDLSIELVRVSGHPALPALEAVAGALADLLPSVRIRRQTDAGAFKPGLRLGAHLIFHAAPAGNEIPPFLDALALTAGLTPSPFSGGQVAALARIRAPARLDLYVGTHCPFCPAMVGRLAAMAVAAPKITLAVTNAQLFADEARDQRIQSVPTLILDGGLRWTGAVEIDALIPALVERDPVRLPAAVLEGMLESGAAGELAEMMAAAGKIFPSLLDLLVDPRWSVRLGAMVAMETLAESAPGLALEVAAPLLARYGGQPSNVRGDMLQVLGTVGSAATSSQIAAVVAGETDTEVLAAADEAMAAIAARRTD